MSNFNPPPFQTKSRSISPINSRNSRFKNDSISIVSQRPKSNNRRGSRQPGYNPLLRIANPSPRVSKRTSVNNIPQSMTDLEDGAFESKYVANNINLKQRSISALKKKKIKKVQVKALNKMSNFEKRHSKSSTLVFM